MFPSGAKLEVLLLNDLLLKTLTNLPPCFGRFGRSKTNIPPVLFVAILL